MWMLHVGPDIPPHEDLRCLYSSTIQHKMNNKNVRISETKAKFIRSKLIYLFDRCE